MELEWFRNYLCDRKQFVFIEGNCSPLLSILLGVPQGSILGPLLFLIYINDLPLASELPSFLFADDTMLLKSGPNINELTDLVNAEFQKLYNIFEQINWPCTPTKRNSSFSLTPKQPKRILLKFISTITMSALCKTLVNLLQYLI